MEHDLEATTFISRVCNIMKNHHNKPLGAIDLLGLVLGLFPFINPTLLSFRFLTTLLLWVLWLHFLLISSLLFPCAMYLLWDTYLVLWLYLGLLFSAVYILNGLYVSLSGNLQMYHYQRLASRCYYIIL